MIGVLGLGGAYWLYLKRLKPLIDLFKIDTVKWKDSDKKTSKPMLYDYLFKET